MADVLEKKRKILVAVDESEESTYALSWCVKNIVSQNSRDTLILLYAKPPRAVYTSLDGTGRGDHSEGTSLTNSMGISVNRRFSGVFGDFACDSGYLFSSDILATMDKYSTEVADCVIEKAKRLCNSQLHGVTVETRVENGDARDVICQMVEKLGADVLVMGSRGYGLIKRAFLGSVSNHCAQNVKCPVLIVKRPKSPPEPKSPPVFVA